MLHARLRAGHPGPQAQAAALKGIDPQQLETRWKAFVLGR